jgi:hypothetical protein
MGRFASLLLLLCAGCVPVALNPFFTPDQWRPAPALLGTWYDEDGDLRWEVTDVESGSYRIRQTWVGELDADDLRPPVSLDAHFARFGDRRVLETRLHEIHNLDATLWARTIPGFTIAVVGTPADTLRLWWLDDDWLKDRLRAGEVSTPHTFAGDRLVLSGDTAELQRLLRQLMGEPEAFANEVEMVRRP